MITITITEADVEEIALEHLRNLGWETAYGPDIERDYTQVILEPHLQAALTALNPDLPYEALDSAFRKVTRPEGASMETRNRSFHRMLVWGVEVEYRSVDGQIRGAQVRLLDFDDPGAND